MILLRKFVCWVFGIEALILTTIFPMAVLVWFRAPQRGSHPNLVSFFLSAAGASVVGGLFACAWWAVKKERASARGWGIFGTTLNVLLSFPVLYYLHASAMLIVWLIPASGVAGVLAFARPLASASAPAKSPAIRPVPGDGTNVLLNKALWLVQAVGIVGCITWWEHWVYVNRIPRTYNLWFYGELIAVIFVVVTVHELGHTVVGLSLGMKLRSFVAGPFQWRLREGKWEFKFNPVAIFASEGAISVVPTTSDWRPNREICVLVAGPAANFCLSAVALGVAFTAQSDDPIQMLGLVALLGAYSLVIGATNLIPFQVGTQYSDGARIYQVASGGPFADLLRAVSMVTSSLVSAMRPRDYDVESIRRAASGAARGRQLMLMRLFEYQYFLDRDQLAEAARAMAEAEIAYEPLAAEVPAELHTDFVYGVAYARRDARDARIWWERMEAKKPTRFNADYWIAHSALHWIEGDMELANQSWHRGNEIAQRLPKAGAYDFDRHKYFVLRRELDEAIALQRNPVELAG